MLLEERLQHYLADGLDKAGLQKLKGVFTVPKQKEHGDFSTNAAFLLAKQLGLPPRDVALRVLEKLQPFPSWVRKVEIAGPGFLNFFLDPQILFDVLHVIYKSGKKYGESKGGGGRKIILEFVSANPTGPLNIVSARAAVVGDVLGNLLKATGYKVHKEFYINDVGNQTDLFAASLSARIQQQRGEEVNVPQDGYQGEYLVDFAKKLVVENGSKKWSLPQLKKVGLKGMVDWQKESLKNFGVKFDKWYSQAFLLKEKLIDKWLDRLRQAGWLYEKDGALFFESTRLGDDKDRVVRKQDGEFSYFASDIAYHAGKFERGFDWAIDLLGPDHHGYIARTKAAVEACGFDPKALTVLIVQQVNLIENDQVVKMSKRAGKLVTMDDLVTEVGRDVARYFFLQRSVSAHLDFDLHLAKQQTPDNPIFYIQYAHARIASIFRKVETLKKTIQFNKVDLKHLDLPEERELVQMLFGFTDVVIKSATELSPHPLANYALDLSRQVQHYYSQAKQDSRYKVIDTSAWDRTAAKLYLLKCVQIVLQNSLRIMGISAPESMSRDTAIEEEGE